MNSTTLRRLRHEAKKIIDTNNSTVARRFGWFFQRCGLTSLQLHTLHLSSAFLDWNPVAEEMNRQDRDSHARAAFCDQGSKV
jgi:hypothetical protein